MLNSVIVVPGRPGFGALLWWFQGPDSTLSNYHFELDGKALSVAPLVLNVGNVLGISTGTAGGVAARTFLMVTAHADGASGNAHQLRVFYKSEPSNIARSRTLPRTADGLNLLLASCYYAGNSRLLAVAPLPKTFRDPANIPHVKMLCGDQIYLDLTFGGSFPNPLDAPWEDYRKQWYDDRFLAWMSHGANLCIADDHEFWNNYPSEKRAGIFSVFFKAAPQKISRQMDLAFQIYQAVLNADPQELLANQPLNLDHLHCFEFPGANAPAKFRQRFCMLVLDTRTQRTALEDNAPAPRFTDPSWLNEVVQKLGGRDGPTLLVTSQSLLDRGGGSESNLADYKEQFDVLLNAVWNCPHQVLLLTGDIHWSRAQRFHNPATKIDHYEVVSSALSRIDLPPGKLSSLKSEVRWAGSLIQALRIADNYASYNYAILGFSTYDLGLRCSVRWWQINGNGEHLPLDMTASLSGDTLDTVSFKRQLMQIPLDLR